MQAPSSFLIQFQTGSVSKIIEVVDNVMREDCVRKHFNLLTVMVEAHDSCIRERYQSKTLLTVT